MNRLQNETLENNYRLCGVYSPEPRVEVYCARLNCNISKLVYCYLKYRVNYDLKIKHFISLIARAQSQNKIWQLAIWLVFFKTHGEFGNLTLLLESEQQKMYKVS